MGIFIYFFTCLLILISLLLGPDLLAKFIFSFYFFFPQYCGKGSTITQMAENYQKIQTGEILCLKKNFFFFFKENLTRINMLRDSLVASKENHRKIWDGAGKNKKI